MGLHWWDLLGLVALGLIIFGPKRLPEMGSSLGKTIREFQKSMREVTDPEPPSSVPPSAAQTAQPVAPAPQAAPVIESAHSDCRRGGRRPARRGGRRSVTPA